MAEAEGAVAGPTALLLPNPTLYLRHEYGDPLEGIPILMAEAEGFEPSMGL